MLKIKINFECKKIVYYVKGQNANILLTLEGQKYKTKNDGTAP